MAVTIICLKLVAFLQWSKCWEQTCAYFFDMPEELSRHDIDFWIFIPLNSCYNYAHYSLKKKKKSEYSYSEWLRNDMFTFSLCPKSKTYRINIKTKIHYSARSREQVPPGNENQGKFLETIKPMRKADKNNRVRLLLCYLTLFSVPCEQL